MNNKMCAVVEIISTYLNVRLKIIYSKHHALFIYLFFLQLTVVLTVQQYIVGYHNIQKVEK